MKNMQIKMEFHLEKSKILQGPYFANSAYVYIPTPHFADDRHTCISDVVWRYHAIHFLPGSPSQDIMDLEK